MSNDKNLKTPLKKNIWRKQNEKTKKQKIIYGYSDSGTNHGATLMTLTPNADAQRTVPLDCRYACVHICDAYPIGVGQSMYVNMWLIEVNPLAYADMPANQQQIVGDIPISEYRWQNYTCLVTAPDGTTTTLGPYTAAAMSTVNVQYTPTQVGTYTFKFSFPGQLIQGKYTATVSYNTYYQEVTPRYTHSATGAITACLNPSSNSYWTLPIDWQNQNMESMGKWLCNTFGVVPSSAG
jgi:hypothetical protein